jgi:chitodextrinase
MRTRVFLTLAVLAQAAWLPAAMAADPAPATALEGSGPNLALANVTEHTVQVRWEPIADATRYELTYGTDPDAGNRLRTFVTGTTYTLSNLMSNTVYRVKVRAVVSGRASAWSPVQEFSTQIPIISGLVADDVRDTSVHLIWSGMFSDLPGTSYEVSFGTDQDATSDGLFSTTKTFLTLKDLKSETAYYIKLRARNDQVVGPWSLPLAVTTLAFSPTSAPSGLAVASGDLGAVVVSWGAVSSAASYDLSYGTDPSAENMGIVPAYENRLGLHLAPNTTFSFKVRAVVKGNSGPWSEVRSFLTLPSAPRGLAVSAQTANSAVVAWKSLSGGNISRYYHLAWGTDPGASNLGLTVTANVEYSLAGLRPDSRYFVRVRTVNTTGASPWCEPFSFSTLPPGLTQLRVLEVHHTTAKITWAEVPAAAAYELAYGLTEEGKAAANLEIGRPPAELKELRPRETYYARIRPIFADRKLGPWSNVLSLTTFAVPPSVRGLTVTERGGTYLNVTWTAAEDISTYEASVSTDPFGERGRVQVANRPEAVLGKLAENTEYFVRVRTLNLGGPGPWSDPVQAVTLPDLSPRNLSVSNVTPTEALLRWENLPGSAPTTYEVRYAPVRRVWKVVQDYPGQTLGLEKLEGDVIYRAQVRAKNASGFGPWCGEVSFQTPPQAPDTAPARLRGVDITDISARVVWEPMEKVDGYLFSLGTDPDASDRGVERLQQTEYSLKGLMPEKSYFVKVKAFNQTGEGPWSEVVLVATRPSPPASAPTGFTVSEITPMSCSLAWQAGEDALSYEVSLGLDPRDEKARLFPCSTPTYVCTDLKPDSTYYLRVRKVNRGGPGPWSRMKTVNTPSLPREK